MSEATAVKAAKTTKETTPVAPQPVSTLSTHREQKLRAAQVKQFVPSSLQTLGMGDFDVLTQPVPAEWAFADCVNPTAWARVASKVSRDAIGQRTRDYVGSTIKLVHPKFYADLVIRKIVRDHLDNPIGLDVACIGPAQDKDGKGCPRNLETGLPWVDPAEAVT